MQPSADLPIDRAQAGAIAAAAAPAAVQGRVFVPL